MILRYTFDLCNISVAAAAAVLQKQQNPSIEYQVLYSCKLQYDWNFYILKMCKKPVENEEESTFHSFTF